MLRVCVVLTWTASCLFVYNWLLSSNHLWKKHPFISSIIVNGGIVLYPVWGLIADAYYGRHRVIRYSLRLMWFISLLYCLYHLLLYWLKEYRAMVESPRHLVYVDSTIKLLMTVAMGGVFANTAVLGVDQLVDAPSYRIASYIRWYGWVWFLADFLVNFIHSCNCKGYNLPYMLEMPLLLSISLCLDFLCSDYLLKEPSFPNPLTMVYKVLRYAWKNKYPRLQSGYAYWDGKLFSRINLAKTKFGGPFTSVQVDDVKTLGRIILLLSCFSIIPVLIIIINSAKGSMYWHFKHPGTRGCHRKCFWMSLVQNFGTFFIVATVPIFELTVVPFLKLKLHMPVLSGAIMSILVVALSLFGLGTIEVVGHYKSHSSNLNPNKTWECFYDLNAYEKDQILPVSYAWLMIPEVFLSCGKYIILTTAGEFLCAQAPSSMKGLLFGLTYGIGGISLILNLPLIIATQEILRRWSPNGACGIIYIFLLMGIEILVAMAAYGASKCYKKRERNEDQDEVDVIPVNWRRQYQSDAELM